jgi:hypothetical protein
MEPLPSGLPEQVADEESLARFATSSSQINKDGAKPSLFLPEPVDRETSVFRHGSQPLSDLWAIGDKCAPHGRNIHGAAILTARDVRECQLQVTASEPPPKHAAIRGWPWIENDPDEQKAQQKELALLLSKNVREILRK